MAAMLDEAIEEDLDESPAFVPDEDQDGQDLEGEKIHLLFRVFIIILNYLSF